MTFQPGEDWGYGVSMDWAGKVLEAVTGQSLGQYSKENIFDPLGCKELQYRTVRICLGVSTWVLTYTLKNIGVTSSQLPETCKDRFVSLHQRHPDGHIEQIGQYNQSAPSVVERELSLITNEFA